MLLTTVDVGHQATIKRICGTEKMQEFLFTLGCYEGEKIKLVSILAGNYVVNIKDSRYALDEKLAASIELGQ